MSLLNYIDHPIKVYLRTEKRLRNTQQQSWGARKDPLRLGDHNLNLQATLLNRIYSTQP